MATDPEATKLKAGALRQALERLSMLGLIDGNTGAASAVLTGLIADAFGHGERNQENLILYAIGRFQVQTPAPDLGERHG
jgi:hypothetical protein